MHFAMYSWAGVRRVAVALGLCAALTAGTLRPVDAETAGQASTRNIILGAVAATAAVILYNNYHHKQMAYNTVVGYTRDGGVVYADGRIVYPDGTVVYTSNNGRDRCGYDGYGVPCTARARAYHIAGWHDNGLHRGWYKHHDNDDQGEDEDDD